MRDELVLLSHANLVAQKHTRPDSTPIFRSGFGRGFRLAIQPAFVRINRFLRKRLCGFFAGMRLLLRITGHMPGFRMWFVRRCGRLRHESVSSGGGLSIAHAMILALRGYGLRYLPNSNTTSRLTDKVVSPGDTAVSLPVVGRVS